MHPRRRSVALSLLVLLTSAPSAASCRGKAGDSLDAASDAAPVDDAGNGGASTAVADAGALARSAALTSAAAAAPPQPTQFTGRYLCFKGGMQLEQVGYVVTSTMHKDATVDTVLACTAIGDACTGTMRDIHLGKTKGKKVVNIRPVTLVRTPAGAVIVKLAPEQKTSDAKSTPSSRAAAAEQIFCPRR